MSHAATNWAIQQRGLKPATKIVLWHLCDCYNPTQGGCFPSQDYLAENCELSRSAINVHLDLLEQAGLIAREQRRQKGSQRQERTRYYFAFEPGFAPTSPEEPSPENGHGAEGEAVSGKSAEPCPENGESRVRNPDSNPVREPLREPVNEREGASERDEGEGQKAGPETGDDHRHLLRRVKAMEIGKAGNPWPGAVGSSTDWALKQFEKLPADERLMAEERRDAYLAICKAQGVKPVALGVYIRDRKFLDVTVEAAREASRKIDRVAIKPFGPVWGGMRAFALAQGPARVDMPGDIRGETERTHAALRKASEQRAQAYRERKGIGINDRGQLVFPDDFEREEHRRRQCSDGYPLVNHLHRLAQERSAELTDGRNQALADLCEAVPVGSEAYEAWREHHTRMNWPLWPDPGQMRVIYFPKGGPEGMRDFMDAARAAMADGEGGRGDAHAA